jgi:hypothetical protein
MRMRQTDREMEQDIIFQEIKKDHEKYGSIDLLRVKSELEHKSVHIVRSGLESRRDTYLQHIKRNSIK